MVPLFALYCDPFCSQMLITSWKKKKKKSNLHSVSHWEWIRVNLMFSLFMSGNSTCFFLTQTSEVGSWNIESGLNLQHLWHWTCKPALLCHDQYPESGRKNTLSKSLNNVWIAAYCYRLCNCGCFCFCFFFNHFNLWFPICPFFLLRPGSSATRVQAAVSPQRRPEARKQEQKPIQEYPAL